MAIPHEEAASEDAFTAMLDDGTLRQQKRQPGWGASWMPRGSDSAAS
jgi:hypothetical protein